ncbi:MAG: low-specificity L-threonine aldolase [Armatimonadetes bacterium]|nr:low-specificity L-threonine aldolase [Armatimonadota bacterium]
MSSDTPIVDLRSDTVTRPTPEMLQAMVSAPVGDDVLGDDPTVQELEQKAARQVGKETSLFVPSGSMANLVSIKTHTQPGDEILLDWDAHSLCYEVGSPAAVAMVQTRQFRSDLGVPRMDELAGAIKSSTLHTPGTVLIVLENTHNRAGGTVIPLEIHQRIYSLAQERGLNVHIDGARIFNASIAAGIPAADYAACADTISFCLSKGLSCPVGSLICGSREFIDRARRVRKMLGGGMRQAGVLAACGLIALEKMVDRLREDHEHARMLAESLSGIRGFRVDMRAVQTNMVYFETVGSAAALQAAMKQRGVWFMPVAERRIRLVTHKDVSREGVEYAIKAFQEAAVS